MLSAALVVGLAGGIIQILQDGRIIDPILHSMATLMGEAGKIASLGVMYLIQTTINIIIPSGSAKAALTMPIMAPLGCDRYFPPGNSAGVPVRDGFIQYDHTYFRCFDGSARIGSYTL